MPFNYLMLNKTVCFVNTAMGGKRLKEDMPDDPKEIPPSPGSLNGPGACLKTHG